MLLCKTKIDMLLSWLVKLTSSNKKKDFQTLLLKKTNCLSPLRWQKSLHRSIFENSVRGNLVCALYSVCLDVFWSGFYPLYRTHF
uniref:Uncharacterized protein n=1 Tax=Oryza brachyantha TaxID=4533 RepID=J3MJF8_ORYBR